MLAPPLPRTKTTLTGPQPSDLMEIAKNATFIQRSSIAMVAFQNGHWEVEVVPMEAMVTTYVLEGVKTVIHLKNWWEDGMLPR
jgi:hypothetical protein